MPSPAAQPASAIPEPSVPGAAPVEVAIPAVKPVDRAKFFAALGNPLRWEMVKMLAGGKALAASQVASALGRDFDGVSKHLRILRRARVLASRSGKDRRLELYFIPEANRPADGALDYGFCVVQVG